MLVWMAPLAMLTIGMKVAPMLTRAMDVWMRPVAMLMIGMMLTLRVIGLTEAVDGKGPAAYRGLVH